MRHIHVKTSQMIGEGAFGRVYRISPRRVVKVFFGEDFKESLFEARSEIRGSKIYKHALPVLELVKVTHTYLIQEWNCETGDYKPGRRIKRTRAAVIKRYIPYTVTDTQIASLYSKNYEGPWDRHPDNYGMDSNGRIYLIDTSCPSGYGIKGS